VAVTRATRRHIPGDGIHHGHRCENLKSYNLEIGERYFFLSGRRIDIHVHHVMLHRFNPVLRIVMLSEWSQRAVSTETLGRIDMTRSGWLLRLGRRTRGNSRDSPTVVLPVLAVSSLYVEGPTLPRHLVHGCQPYLQTAVLLLRNIIFLPLIFLLQSGYHTKHINMFCCKNAVFNCKNGLCLNCLSCTLCFEGLNNQKQISDEVFNGK
jgi:hypothetical protein